MTGVRIPASVLPCALLCLAGCGSLAPWTVRPIEGAGARPQKESAKFDGVSYVSAIWSSRVLPTVMQKAVDLPALLAALRVDPEGGARKFGRREGTGPYNFLVKGEGRVAGVATASRSGLVGIDLPPFDGKPEASLQVGPVIRGTALRDAVGFLHFDQFVNQLDYADVSNALNDRVSKEVLSGIHPNSLRGATLRFWGAFSLEESPASPVRPEIVPVKLVVEPKRK